MASSMTAAPNGARRARAARRSVRQRRSRRGRAAAAPARVGADTLAMPDPGVDPAIEEIHRQVAHDEAGGDQQDNPLH